MWAGAIVRVAKTRSRVGEQRKGRTHSENSSNAAMARRIQIDFSYSIGLVSCQTKISGWTPNAREVEYWKSKHDNLVLAGAKHAGTFNSSIAVKGKDLLATPHASSSKKQRKSDITDHARLRISFPDGRSFLSI